MRIAVLGSWRQEDQSRWNLLENPEEFGRACKRVGRELIERGHSIIVGAECDSHCGRYGRTGRNRGFELGKHDSAVAQNCGRLPGAV